MILLEATERENIRQFTGVTSTTIVSNAQMDYYIQTEEAVVMRKTGLKFYNAVADEWYDGDGEATLSLKRYPASNVTYLEIDDIVIDGCCFYVYPEKALILLKTGAFTEDEHNVHVIYTYGAPSTSDPERFNTAKSIAFKKVAIKVLQEAGNKDSKGFLREKMEAGKYELDYGSRGPYGNTIKQLKEDITEAYDSLGIRVGARVI
jgi:hypothetical protein